jgi:hypothetical protein
MTTKHDICTEDIQASGGREEIRNLSALFQRCRNLDRWSSAWIYQFHIPAIVVGLEALQLLPRKLGSLSETDTGCQRQEESCVPHAYI